MGCVMGSASVVAGGSGWRTVSRLAEALNGYGCWHNRRSRRIRMSGFADYEQYDALGLADLVRRKESHAGRTA